MVSLEHFAQGLNTLERSLLEDFLRGRTLSASNQPVQNGQLRLPKVAGAELCSHVKHFLGYHMIKEFEVLDFLEESGLYVEGMEGGEEDVAALERRWLKPIYTAAPKLVLRLLQWLCKEEHYQEDELSSALAIATKSVDELPRCAQLSHFLPGPSQSAYELSHSGNVITRDSSFIAPLLQSRYQDVCPAENFWGIASRGARDNSKVESEHSGRMQISAISSSGTVTFRPCQQGSSSWPEELAGGIEIAFEKSMLPLFWKGLVVAATYQKLKDGQTTRWALSQPGYVWPSWMHGNDQQKAAS